MPYADTVLNGSIGRCDAGQHPNGGQADVTIQVTSHEHNETITEHNQTINGRSYFLQPEWSNHSSGCVQHGI